MLYPQQNPARQLIDLSGLWDFHPDPQGVGETRGFFEALPEARPIAVPGSWNEQYADLFDYLSAGWYLRRVVVPPSWKGQRIFLRIGSANYRAVVWVNGQPVGGHEGGHLPFAMEVTRVIRFGAQNTIAILVENQLRPDRVPSGGMGDMMTGIFRGYPDTTFDFYHYAGLHRPVVLYAVPPDFIEDITVITGREDGVVHLRVEVRVNGRSKKASLSLSGSGEPLETTLQLTNGQGQAELTVPSARLWSPADPFLYDLSVSSGDDVYTLPIGLRTVEVDSKQLLLNGEPIYLRGFGRHEDFYASGRGLNLPLLVKDYDLMRWVGANSYRTSHYPYSEEEMQLADRLGFLIIDEIPAVSLQFEDEATVAKRKITCLRMLEELIARDKNHPSVVMWCVANEPMLPNQVARLTGKDTSPLPQYTLDFFRDLIDHAHRLDPTRPVTLAGMMGSPLEWQALTDVISINRYWGWYEQGGRLEQAFATFDQELDLLYETFQKPILISEFGADTAAGLHAHPPVMWSEEYQAEFIRGYLETANRKDFVIGAHVWNFADFQSLQSHLRVGGMNLKGVFTRDRRPKLAAHVLRQMWQEAAQTAAPTVEPVWAPSPPTTTAPAPPGPRGEADELRSLMEDVVRRLDGTKPGLTTTLKFDFGAAGIYRFVIVNGRVTLAEGDGEAAAWAAMKASTAIALFHRRMNPMAAVVTGRIKVGGDLKALSVLRDI